jgi:hypothetical protein
MIPATSTSRAPRVRQVRSLKLRAFVLSLALLAACDKHAPEPAPATPPAPPAQPKPPPPASPGDPKQLPEDPAAAKRSEAQWREHMKDEEDERQAAYDKQHLAEHRAMMRLIAAARARYDAARTEDAIAKARIAAQTSIDDMNKRVAEIDHWGTNSRLLPDYAAIETTLGTEYPDAKLAALKGDASAFKKVRDELDQRMKKMEAWLDEVEAGEHEEHERKEHE